MVLPHPRPRLLRGRAAEPALGGDRPHAPGRPAGGLRPAPPCGPAPRGGGGYAIGYPPTDWTAIPGDHDWTFETDLDAFNSTAPDRFETQGAADGLGIRLSVWSASVDPGTSLGDWIETYCVEYQNEPCTNTWDILAADGWDVPSFGVADQGVSRIVGWNNPTGEPMAALLGGETVYVAAIWRSDNDPSVRPWGGSQRLLEAFLRTMALIEPATESPASS